MEQLTVPSLAPVPATAAPTPVSVAPTPEPSWADHLTSTCPLLTSEMVPVLAEELGKMTVDKLSPVVVPLLAELFGEDELQEELTSLPAISFSSSLLALLPEVFDLSVLVGLTLAIVTHTSAAPLHCFSLPLFPLSHWLSHCPRFSCQSWRLDHHIVYCR